MSTLILGQLLAGLVLLGVGAECLVQGAASLARRFGVSALVVGLTVVAFGTSAPELAVSVQASLNGSGDIAVGNVLGSNIANILLILGLSALVRPLLVSRQLLRLDVPVMIVAGSLAFILALDGYLQPLEGAALILGILLYTGTLLATGKRRHCEESSIAAEHSSHGWVIALLLVVLSLGLLVTGSHLLVEGAAVLARAFGLSELVIGLTIVAVGTSLPELATSVLATWRGERDIAVGNVVGSCIFNLLLVLGASAFVTPDGLSVSPNALSFNFPVMLAASLACLPIFISGYRINRWEGALLLGYYLAYTLYLVMFSSGLGPLSQFRHAMSWYVLPVTSIVLLLILLRACRHQP